MLTEQWLRWEPLPNLEKQYTMVDFVDDNTKLEIFLTAANNPKNRIHIIFEHGTLVYRYTTIPAGKQAFFNQLKQSFSDWTFFKVNNSMYVQ